ncbi:MAG: DNA-processing protein DprA [Clostridia bacterium]|nr:DNA-processing protein DprA [Clostridia bacterium]MBR0422190.1 DNA-processing protein DprA [Clostridia bacterium]
MIDSSMRPELWLHYGVGPNPRQFSAVREEYYYLEEAMEDVARGRDSRLTMISGEARSRLKEALGDGFMDRYVRWMDKNGVNVVTATSYEYPALLKEIPDPPPVLFYRGTLNMDMQLPLAIVGTRRCTEYGKEVAKKFGRELVKAGATVVSGLATGIDGYAALGALSVEGAQDPTVAVLGCGIDVVYPQGNEKLYGAIAERGCLMTEFLPKTPPLPRNFPQRNRIISGLSLGVLVVEAGERSGSAVTARLALEQGREVFAVPGRITDPMSVGTNAMIRRGEAKAVTSVSDILEEFGEGGAGDEVRSVRFDELSPLEQRVVKALSEGEKNEDELLERCGGGVDELISTLTGLTFSGIIKQLPGSVYALDTLETNIVY